MFSKSNLKALIVILSGLALVLVVLNLKRPDVVKYQKAQIFDQTSDDTLPKTRSLDEQPLFTPVKLTSKKIVDFQINSENKGIVYVDENGMIEGVGFDGKDRKVVRKADKPVSEAVWSVGGSSLIEKFGFSSAPRYFRLSDKVSSNLHPAIKFITFSPSSEKIVYHFFEDQKEEGNLAISDPDGGNYRIVYKTKISALNLFWSQNNRLFFYPTNKQDATDLFSLNTDGSDFKKIMPNISEPNIFWSKDGNSYLISYKSDGKERFELRSQDGRLLKTFSVSGVLSCLWSLNTKSVFCGKDGEIGKLDLETGEYQTMVTFSLKPIKILASSLEDILIIKNSDDTVYSIKIEK
ncbi:MAG: hypothetical protein HYW77_02760 [Parcubacteria group bacterium]|nr:hypothetical protein [Parcubacteria group bacterium]